MVILEFIADSSCDFLAFLGIWSIFWDFWDFSLIQNSCKIPGYCNTLVQILFVKVILCLHTGATAIAVQIFGGTNQNRFFNTIKTWLAKMQQKEP